MCINKKAFTLIELLVVIVIVGIIVMISITLFSTMKRRSRDVKRITDIKQLHTALEMYYDEMGRYPDNIRNGIGVGGTVFLKDIPVNPTPMDDGNCSESDYVYATTSDASRYTIDYCISTQVGEIVAGNYSAIPETIASVDSLPSVFSYTDQKDVALSTQIESNIALITGIGTGITASIAGDGSPQYRICDNATCSGNPAWTSIATVVDNNQYIQLKLTSNALILQTDTVHITVGSETKDWSVSTQICISGNCYSVVYNKTTGDLSGHAWGSFIGYVSFKGTSPTVYGVNVPVAGGLVTGDAWGPSSGYIYFEDHDTGDGIDYGVTYNAGTQKLTGYAWSPTFGYIKMDGVDYSVTVPVAGGNVTGYAWGSSAGYIKFTGSIEP